jgi:hypothetical protein
MSAEERQAYTAWIVYWGVLTGCDEAALRNLAEAASTEELVRTYVTARELAAIDNIRWGVGSAPTASPDERQKLLDALVGIDTNFLSYGNEQPVTPTARGAILEATPIWARSRRGHLAKLSPAALAKECRHRLDLYARDVAEDAERRAGWWAADSQRGRALVAVRWQWTDYLRQAAAYCVANEVRPSRAARFLREEPYQAKDGTVVTLAGDRIVVYRDKSGLGAISERQFQRRYMTSARHPK